MPCHSHLEGSSRNHANRSTFLELSITRCVVGRVLGLDFNQNEEGIVLKYDNNRIPLISEESHARMYCDS
uniref:Uncharacterized protein n=1 Tax=Rhizophora mucronata TaxID=61149 RepID=A0A2P2PJ70_RHIMU